MSAAGTAKGITPPREERERVNRSRLDTEMERGAIDVIVAASPTNVTYLTRAFLDDQRERLWDAMLQFAVWPRAGEPAVVVSKSAEGQVRRSGGFRDVRPYDWPQESPVPVLVDVLEERGLARGRVGLELGAMPATAYIELRSRLREAAFADCGPLLERTRTIKTPGEVDALASLAHSTERAILAAYRATTAGDTERLLAERMTINLLKEGVDETRVPWVGRGVNATTRRRRPSEDRLQRGDMVRTDFGAWRDGFASDIARMAVVGTISRRQQDVYARVHEVQADLIAAMRHGARCGELYATYSERIERYGLPFSGGILMHGIGLRVHEHPLVRDASSDATLESGMVMAVEPSVTIQGEAKYTLEDLVLVTDDGARRLSDIADTASPSTISG